MVPGAESHRFDKVFRGLENVGSKIFRVPRNTPTLNLLWSSIPRRAKTTVKNHTPIRR